MIADLCATAPAPAAAPDPDDSAAYAHAGDDARAAGDVRIAAIAYRRAIALDRGNTAARDALAALCRAEAAPDDAVLDDAIARYRRGDLDGAEAALLAIEPASAGVHFFLGMIALRRHQARRAVRELELARLDPAYEDTATAMLRLAHRDGPVAGMLIAEPELDTNPQLLPDTPPAGASSGPPQPDQDLLLAASLTVRPWRWLAVRDVVAWRNQRNDSALDFIGENAQLAAELERVELRYDLDADWLAGSSYLIASRGAATYRHELGDLTLEARYALRRRDYQQATEAAFTGWVHEGSAGVRVRATGALDFELRGSAWRELTLDPAFSDVAGGMQVVTRARPDARVRITAALALWYARYDGAQPDGTLRRDAHGEGSVDLEVDLADHVIALAGTSVARNDSTIEDFRYWKIVVRAGIALAFGGP